MLKKFIKTTAIIGAIVATLGVTTSVDAASFGTVTASSLYVRSGASTSYKILGTVTKGKKVEIQATENGWHKIEYNGNDGWVSGKYISTSGSTSTEGTTSGSTSNGTTTTTKTGTITTSSLNVRSGAGTSYSILGALAKGKTVTIYGESNGWYKISYNGGYGWVSKTYVSTGSTSTGSSSSNTLAGYKVKGTLNVRAVAYTGGTHTALGTPVRYGVIAVDPKVIPYRTKVYIKELNKVFVAEDCGGGIKGNIIDIYMPTLAQCYSWGSRNITLQILE
ncbi:SH3 domain-containing protein [Intestinibacter sp.]